MKNNGKGINMKKFFILIIVIVVCLIVTNKIQDKNQRKYWSAESEDGNWGLYAVKDQKGFWEGFLIYFGNVDGDIGKIKISGNVGDGEERNEEISPEDYIDDYKKVISKTSGKKRYYSVVIWGSGTPDITLKICYYEKGERKETKVKMTP